MVFYIVDLFHRPDCLASGLSTVKIIGFFSLLSQLLLRGSTIDDLEELERRIADRRKLEVNALTRIVFKIVPNPLRCVSFRLHRPGQDSMQGAGRKSLADRGIHRRLSLLSGSKLDPSLG